MKKTLLALLMLASTAAFSQSISGGLKAGVNITNFSGKNVEGFKKSGVVGFNAGGYLNIGLGAIALQPELLVSTAGAQLENGDVNFKQKFNLTYIAVPIMLQSKSGPGFFFEAGPQFAFKIDENTGDETIKNFAKDLDLSVAVGVGFRSDMGLGINARYVAGLTKVGDFDNDEINPDYKNSVIQVGLSFRLGK